MTAKFSNAIAIALTITLSAFSGLLPAQDTVITDAAGITVYSQPAMQTLNETSIQIQAPSPGQQPPAISAPGGLQQWGDAQQDSYPEIPAGSVIVPDNTIQPRTQTTVTPYIVPSPRVAPILPPPPAFIPKLGFNGRYIAGYGMQVTSVSYGSVAESIGLEAGDVIIKIDGQRLNCVVDYEEALLRAATYGGGHVDLVVRNVRYRPGCSVNPKFVSLHADLPQRPYTVATSAIGRR